MKGIFFAAILLSCAALLFSAKPSLCQSPMDSGSNAHVLVTGRPWETDENKMTFPLEHFPGRTGTAAGRAVASHEPWSGLQGENIRLSGNDPEHAPLGPGRIWIRFELILLRLQSH